MDLLLGVEGAHSAGTPFPIPQAVLIPGILDKKTTSPATSINTQYCSRGGQDFSGVGGRKLIFKTLGLPTASTARRLRRLRRIGGGDRNYVSGISRKMWAITTYGNIYLGFSACLSLPLRRLIGAWIALTDPWVLNQLQEQGLGMLLGESITITVRRLRLWPSTKYTGRIQRGKDSNI